MASDPIVFQLPLIGAWLYSNDQNEELLSKTSFIWAIITEFVTGSSFKTKITNDSSDKSFLFVLFQKYHTPVFFDVKVLDSDKASVWKLLRQNDSVHADDLESHIITFHNA
jgi:SCL-interrupting locus protein N-terminus